MNFENILSEGSQLQKATCPNDSVYVKFLEYQIHREESSLVIDKG